MRSLTWQRSFAVVLLCLAAVVVVILIVIQSRGTGPRTASDTAPTSPPRTSIVPRTSTASSPPSPMPTAETPTTAVPSSVAAAAATPSLVPPHLRPPASLPASPAAVAPIRPPGPRGPRGEALVYYDQVHRQRGWCALWTELVGHRLVAGQCSASVADLIREAVVDHTGATVTVLTGARIATAAPLEVRYPACVTAGGHEAPLTGGREAAPRPATGRIVTDARVDRGGRFTLYFRCDNVDFPPPAPGVNAGAEPLDPCEWSRATFPQSSDEVAITYDLPPGSDVILFSEVCGHGIVTGFILRSPREVTLPVPPGGCIDSHHGAAFSATAVPEPSGGLRTSSGTVRAREFTVRGTPCERSAEAAPVAPAVPPTVPRRLVADLASRGETAEDEQTRACLDRVHGAYRHTDVEAGQPIPPRALVATNFREAGRRWSEFPVRPICHRGDWGLFESTSAFAVPHRGAYWLIVP